MSIFGRFIGRIFGTGQSEPSKKLPNGTIPRPRSKYDSAQTTDENRNHWANSDLLSANAANTPSIRQILRARSRYERANNGYAKGLIKSRTVDTIGTGPRLQIELPEQYLDPEFQVTQTTGTAETPDASDLAREVERKWCEWADSIGLYDKIRVMAEAEDGDGEAFALFVNNDNLDGVQMDLRVIEADRVSSPDLWAETPTAIDGIRYDANGNPTEYDILDQHPGDNFFQLNSFTGGTFAITTYKAAQVIHLFEMDRPEQRRGIPILTPSLPLYAIMRRFTTAVLGAAELAAMIAGVIENPNGPVDGSGDDAPEFEAMDQIPFARGALLTLYGGQQAKAFNPAQPAPGYDLFKAEILSEAGRSTGAPRNVSTGNSSNYNFASGRLDLLPYHRAIRCRRERYERHLLDRVYVEWLKEAAAIPGYLPAGLPPVDEWEWEWEWDGFDFIDPMKEAKANETLLTSGQATLKEICGSRGTNWVDVIKQRGREKALMDQYGLTMTAPAPTNPANDIANQPEDASGNPIGDPAGG